jgi:hypothetical protein
MPFAVLVNGECIRAGIRDRRSAGWVARRYVNARIEHDPPGRRRVALPLKLPSLLVDEADDPRVEKRWEHWLFVMVGNMLEAERWFARGHQ